MSKYDLSFSINLNIIVTTTINRRSRPEVFCKKVVLRNYAKLTGKHLCQGLFFNKVAGFSVVGFYPFWSIMY